MTTISKRSVFLFFIALLAAAGFISYEISRRLHRNSHRYAYLGNNVGLVKTTFGHNIHVNTNDGVISREIILRGSWEKDESKLIQKLITKDSRIIEVGSNIGWYTILMNWKMKKGNGYIYAYEANPDNVKLLNRSVGHAENVRVFNNAVWDSTGKTLELAVSDLNVGGASVAEVGARYINAKDGLSRSYKVSTVTLDGTVDLEKPIDFIKMDCEGSELRVLAGAKEVLKRNPNIVIVMEWGVGMLAANSDVPKELDNYISQGYKFYRVNGKSYKAIDGDIKTTLMSMPHLVDIIMTKKDL